MILHAAEVWLTLAACFVLGALAGSIAQRAISLTALGRPQARLIRGIDRVIRWLEWRLLPWRGAVPVVLPQTVPVPPPDFGHVLIDLDEPAPYRNETPRAEVAEIDPIMLPSVLHAPAPARLEPARAEAAASPNQAEAIARADAAGFRPIPLYAPRNGRADPLFLIRGVTKRHAAKLGQVGVFHFSQIASWTPQELAWIAAYLGAGDGPAAKDWVGQAVHFAGSDLPIEVPVKAPAKAKGKSTSKVKRTEGGDAPLRRKKSPARRPRRAPGSQQVKADEASTPAPEAVAIAPEEGAES
ncbi:hypothetical protein [Kaistia nematophila]|uniref:Uncharacterized protein n=1 Tax=Kaistia nematophila TaxID=2994654 RepID=A0A9X3DZG8_9HYPH|nr:hypothetical protein [Kaistia nematophila]MCX5568871.1 hypothetical protein [Kaistia nematophila]